VRGAGRSRRAGAHSAYARAGPGSYHGAGGEDDPRPLRCAGRPRHPQSRYPRPRHPQSRYPRSRCPKGGIGPCHSAGGMAPLVQEQLRALSVCTTPSVWSKRVPYVYHLRYTQIQARAIRARVRTRAAPATPSFDPVHARTLCARARVRACAPVTPRSTHAPTISSCSRCTHARTPPPPQCRPHPQAERRMEGGMSCTAYV
jgi:hypothetical protein